MNEAEEKVITPVEYARACGLTLGYVYALLWTGRLAGAQKIGRQWRIPASAIRQRVA